MKVIGLAAALSAALIALGSSAAFATDDLVLLRADAGWNTSPRATANGAQPFTIQNRAAGMFAQWAIEPGVTALQGDFNGDGRSDLALLKLGARCADASNNCAWATMPVAYSLADGTVDVRNEPIGDFALWARTAGVVPIVGNFDADATSDVALVNRSAGWNTAPVLLSPRACTRLQIRLRQCPLLPPGQTVGFKPENRGAPQFAAAAAIVGVDGEHAIVVPGDFNGDGCSDLLTLHPAANSNRFRVARCNAQRNGFDEAETLAYAFTNIDASTFRVGDFNADGRTDLFGLSTESLNATVREPVPHIGYGTASGFQVSRMVSSSPYNIYTFASWWTGQTDAVLGDFNGDRATDIALLGWSNPHGIARVPVAFGRPNSGGTNSFDIQNLAAPNFAGWSATPGVRHFVGDFNGDSRSDIALLSTSNDLTWSTIPIASYDSSGWTTQNQAANQTSAPFADWARSTPNMWIFAGRFGG